MNMCICYTLLLWLLICQTHERARQGRLRARFMKDIRYMYAHSLSGLYTHVYYIHTRFHVFLHIIIDCTHALVQTAGRERETGRAEGTAQSGQSNGRPHHPEGTIMYKYRELSMSFAIENLWCTYSIYINISIYMYIHVYFNVHNISMLCVCVCVYL